MSWLTPLTEPTGLGSLRHKLNRLLENFESENGGELAAGRGWAPPLDIADTPEALVITAEVPGLDVADLDVSVSGRLVTITGEKQRESETQGKTWRRVERSYGRFSRTVTLPGEVDPEAVEAHASNGVLTITARKRAGAQGKKIPVAKS